MVCGTNSCREGIAAGGCFVAPFLPSRGRKTRPGLALFDGDCFVSAMPALNCFLRPAASGWCGDGTGDVANQNFCFALIALLIPLSRGGGDFLTMSFGFAVPSAAVVSEGGRMREVEERNLLSRDVMALSVVVEDEAVVTGKDSFASAASAALAAPWAPLTAASTFGMLAS